MSRPKNRRGGFNIGLLMFGAIFVYLIITFFLYATTKHVTTYVVKSGTISDNETVSALILREEKVVKATGGGYINYFVQDSEKTSNGEEVCSVEPQATAEGGVIDEDTLALLRKDSADFQTSYQPSDFQSVYDYEYDMETEILKSGNGSPDSARGDVYTSDDDGIVAYSYDGGEDLNEDNLTDDAFQASKYQRTLLQKNATVKSGQPLYRLVTSEDWEIVFPISETQYKKLSDRTSIRVRFARDRNTETGLLSFLGEAGSRYAKISFASGVIRYINDRVVNVELMLSSSRGLKIPTTSIVQKEFFVIPTDFGVVDQETLLTGFDVEQEDGTTEYVSPDIYYDSSLDAVYTDSDEDARTYYYVDKDAFPAGTIVVNPETNQTYETGETGTLDGVYTTNRGYAVFRRVNILQQNTDYTLVQPNASYSINQYDYIVQDARNVSEKEIVLSDK